MKLPDIARNPEVAALVQAALAEDIGSGDATTRALVPPGVYTEARLVTREPCVVAGLPVAAMVFSGVEPSLQILPVTDDGATAEAGEVLMTIAGPADGILTAERTALNFMQRLCGIATLTAAFVRRAQPHGVDILDTRKTTPCLRVLEKYAVRCGGGKNHRTGLYDRVLIKDNHRRFWSAGGELRLDAAVRAARADYPGLAIEIEVESEAELESALGGAPDWVLLDNMAPALMRRCVALCRGRCRTEASGGITLETIDAVVTTGIDAISLGCLTHSARAIDLSLEL